MIRHDKRLCMMYPRLKLLADDGVIFISIDDIEVTYLRLIDRKSTRLNSSHP